MAVHSGDDTLACMPGAVEVRNELSQKLRLELPSTAVFDYPTVSALCNFISTVTARTSGRLFLLCPGHSALRQQS